MRYLFLFIMLYLMIPTCPVRAQVVVSGVVQDALTNAPLSEVTVQVEDGFQATVTNAEGRFEILLETFPKTLRIGRIGYTSHRLLINAESTTLHQVMLVPAVYDLEPVIVTEHESVTDIMRRVIERKKEWRARLHSLHADGYARFTIENDTSIVFIIEGLGDVLWDHKNGWKAAVQSYRRSSNILTDEDMDNLRTLDELATDALIFNYYDDNIRISDHILMGVTHPDALKKYNFTMEGQRLRDDQLVYDISVKPKSKLFSGFVGRISVIDRDYAMIEADLQPGEAFFFPPPINDFNVRARQQFAKFGNDLWLPVGLTMNADAKVGLIGFVFPRIKMNLTSQMTNYKVIETASDAAVDTTSLPDVNTSPDRVVKPFIADSTLIKQGLIVPLTAFEAQALDTIDSTVTFFKAFEPQGFIANQLKKRGVFEDIDNGERDEKADLSLSGSRREGRSSEANGRLQMDYKPEIWFNRVDAGHFGLKANTTIHALTLNGTGAYNTGTKRWTYGGGFTLRNGRRGRHALSIKYMNGSEPRYQSSLYSPSLTSLVTLFGGDDYFDYFLNERINFQVSSYIDRYRRLQVTGRLNIEQHRSLAKTTDYALLGINHTQRLNPAITTGNLRSLSLKFDYGRKPKPFSPEKVNYFSLQTEYSHPDMLSSDYSFTQTRGVYVKRINTFFQRRMLPNTLDIRLSGGFSSGTLPPQRFGIVDGSLSASSQPGTFRSLRGQPYEGEHHMGVFWDHNFRTVPFELIGLTALVRRGIGINVYGGHGRTWISNNRLSSLGYTPQYQGRYHHEVGISLTGLMYFFRLDFTKRIDSSGFFVGLGLGPSFVE